MNSLTESINQSIKLMVDTSVYENTARLLREGNIEGYNIIRGAYGAIVFVNNTYSSGPTDLGKTL